MATILDILKQKRQQQSSYQAPTPTGKPIPQQPDLMTKIASKIGASNIPVPSIQKTPSIITPELRKQAGPEIGNFLKTMARAFPRAAATISKTTGAGVTSFPGLGVTGMTKTSEIPEETKVGKFIYGEEPIKTVSELKVKYQPTVEKVAEKLGAKEGTAKVISEYLTTPLIIGGLLMDLTPLGGGRKAIANEGLEQFVKFAAKEEGEIAIKQAAKDLLRVSDKEAEIIARNTAPLKNSDEIMQSLNLSKEKPLGSEIVDDTITPDNKVQAIEEANKASQVVDEKLVEKVSKTNLESDISETLRKEGYIPTEQNILDLKSTGNPEEITTILKTMKKDVSSQSTGRQYYNKGREFLDDSAQRLKDFVRNKEYKKTGELNIYEKRSIFPNVLRAKVQKIKDEGEQIIKRLEQKQKDLKIPSLKDDASSYAKYKHSIEYNKFHGEGMSGVTTESAQKELSRIEALPHFKEIEQAQKELVEFNKKIFKEAYESGNLSKEAMEEIEKAGYDNYVAMNRVMDDLSKDTIQGVGSRTDVLGSGIQKRKGSVREVKNVFDNSVENAIRLSNRNEKNIFNNKIAIEVENNPFMGKVVSAEDFKTVEKASDQNTLAFNRDGKKMLVVFDDPLIADAVSGANLINTGMAATVVNTVGTMTKIYNNLLTRFNAGFMGANPVRDIQEMMVALDSLNLKDASSIKTALNVPKSQKEILDHIYRGKKSKDYEELISLGGAQGGQSLSLIGEINPKKINEKGVLNTMIRQFDNVNEILENATRLSVYKNMKKAGLSNERAAYIANESTINYARRGTAGPVINSLYSFANVSLQANAKFLRAMKNPKTAAKVAGTVYGVSLAQDQVNNIVDPNWRDQIPEKTRDTNVIWVYGKNEDGSLKYAKIPLAQSLRPMFIASNAINGDVPIDTNISYKIANSLFEMFNPLGGTLENPIEMITPTIARPVVDIWQNKSWTGTNIKPETYGKPTPESERYYDSLTKSALGKKLIAGTQKLAEHGVEISPASVEYLIKQMTGGLGKSILDSTQSLVNTIEGEGVRLAEIPVVSRFVGETDIERIKEPVRKNLTEANIEQERENSQVKRKAKAIYEELDKLSPQEMKNRLKEYILNGEVNEEMFNKIMELKEQKGLDLGKNDRQLLNLEVKSGNRARAIIDEISELSPEKKKAKIKDYVIKKIITEEVFNQMATMI